MPFKFRKKHLFLRLHSEEPLDGDSLVIFGLETHTSKDAALELCYSEYVCNSLNNINWVISQTQNPYPSLHIICRGLISRVFTWIGLVTDDLFIRPSRDSSPSLYVFILLINMEDNTVWDPMTNFYWLAWTLGRRACLERLSVEYPAETFHPYVTAYEFKAFMKED